MFIGKEGGIEIIHNLIKTNQDGKVCMFSTIEYTFQASSCNTTVYSWCYKHGEGSFCHVKLFMFVSCRFYKTQFDL